MVSRRIFFKSMSILSGGIALAGTPVTSLAAKSSAAIGGNTRKMRLVVVGHEKSAEPYLKYAKHNPDSLTIVAPASADGFSTASPDQLCFATFESFIESGAKADIVLLAGIKNNKSVLLKALKSGYQVWSDRPVAFSPSACKKLNNIAAGFFSKIRIAHVINNDICLMENKIYSARV